VDFEEALARLGFHEASDGLASSRGARIFTAEPNRYLTYTVQAYENGTALFSWEFALGEYLLTKGIQVGSDETLNQFAYPREDDRGPQDGAWLTGAIDRAEALLAEVRLDRPE
jgi:hypothetical protein